MRVDFLLGFAVLGLLLASGPADAQRRWGPNQVPYCDREATEDECRVEETAALIDRLDLPAAEALALDGYAGIRIFQYDAFGNIWPAVTVMSRPTTLYRREGFVAATTVHADGHVATLTRPIWENAWIQADLTAEAVIEAPPPAPPVVWDPSLGAPPPPAPCLDPPRIRIEAIAHGQVTRWSPPACESSATLIRVAPVRDMVAAAFPACGHLAIEKYGYSLGRLRACLLLEGPDPVAAIPVLEALHVGVEGHLNRPLDPAIYDPDVRLTVGDAASVVGPAAVDAAVKAGALGPRWIRIVRFTGNDGHVVVHGLLNASREASPSETPFTQVWAASDDGVVRMQEWRVP